jgi:hypothetical protein
MNGSRLWVLFTVVSVLIVVALWMSVATGSAIGKLYPLVFLIPAGNRLFISKNFPERRREFVVGAFQYACAFVVLAGYKWVETPVGKEFVVISGFVAMIVLAFVPGGRFSPVGKR